MRVTKVMHYSTNTLHYLATSYNISLQKLAYYTYISCLKQRYFLMSTLVINRTIKSIAGSCDLPRCCNCCSVRLYRIVAQVVAVCAAPCVRFGPFNAFLLLFQKEQSQGTSATTVTRGTMD